MSNRPEIVSLFRRLAWWKAVEPPFSRMPSWRIFPARPECLESRIVMDAESVAFPAPFVGIGPDGGLAYEATFQDSVGTGETDSFLAELNLDGETVFVPLPSNQSDGDGGVEGGDLVVHFAQNRTTTPISSLKPVQPSGSLVYEGTFEVVLASAGDAHDYTIVLEAGERITFFADADASVRPKMTLRDAANSVLASISASTPGEDVALQTFIAPATGTYTLTVEGETQTNGIVTVRALLNAVIEPETPNAATNNSLNTAVDLDGYLSSLPGGGAWVSVHGNIELIAGLLPKEIEVNDSFARANLALSNFTAFSGNLYQLAVKGTRDHGEDRDFFSIGPLDAGDVITIGLSGKNGARGSLSDPVFTLYRGSTGTPVMVFSDDNSGPGADALGYRYTIDQSDTYYIMASGAMSSSTDTYDLTVWLENTGAAPITGGSFISEIEGNNTAATANNVSTSWQKVQYRSRTTGSIGYSTDADYYRFEFRAGDLVTVNLDSAGSADLRAAIFDSAGKIIAVEDGTSNGPGADSQIFSFRIPSTGTYYVRAITGGTTGAYTADVYLSSSTRPPIVGSADDFYGITLNQGEKATFAINTTAGIGTKIELQDGTGKVLAVGVANSDGSTIIHDFVASEAGRYYVHVTGTIGNEYNLLALRNADFDRGNNDTVEMAQPLGSSGVVLGHTGPMLSDRVFAYDSIANLIQEINPQTGSVIRSFASPAAEIPSSGELALATTGSTLLVAGSIDSSIYEVDPNTGTILRSFQNNQTIVGLAFLNGKIYTYSDGIARIGVIDYQSGAAGVLSTFPVLGDEGGLAAANGALYCIDKNDFLYRIDLNTGSQASLGRLEGIGTARGLGIAGNELFVTDGTEIEVFNLSTLAPVRTLAGFNGLTAIGADGEGQRDNDYYQIHATAGETLTLSTATPGGARNTFDPMIVLYDASGKLVASDNNGADDGRNAMLTYTAQTSGIYTIYVRGATSASGDYVLSVGGADEGETPLSVVSTTPAANGIVSAKPGAIRVNFNQDLLLSSLQASDFLINGVAASSFTLIDGNTVEFPVPATIGHGTHQVTIPAGALTSLSSGPVEAYSGAFTVDLVAPRVTSINVQKDQILAPGALVLTIGFSEPVDMPNFLDSAVLLKGALRGANYSPSAINFNPAGDVVTIAYPSLPDDNYTLTLRSGLSYFHDLSWRPLDGEATNWPIPENQSGDGTNGGDFVMNFTVDARTPGSFSGFTPLAPMGGLVYGSSENVAINDATDSDEFSIHLEAGQSLTLVAHPEGLLRPAMALLDSMGNVIASSSNTLGGDALVHVPAVSGGTYMVRLSGVEGSVGAATVRAFLNASVETEELGGGSNNSAAAAQNVDALFTALPGGGKIVRIGGVIDRVQSTDDFYAVSLDAGEQFAFALGIMGSGNVEVIVQDGTGVPVVVGTQETFHSGVVMHQFTAPAAGTYHVRVAGDVGAAYHLAMLRDGAFDFEGNENLSAAHDLNTGTPVVGYAGQYTQDRLYVFDASTNLIKQVERETGSVIRSFPTPVTDVLGVFGLATTARTLLVGGDGNAIYELNADTGTVIRTISVNVAYTKGLAFLNDEIYVLGSTFTGQIAVLDYQTGILKRTITASDVYYGIASTEGGLLGTGVNGNVYEIDALTGATTLRGSVPGSFAEGLGVIGNELYIGGASGLDVFRYPSLEPVRTLNGLGRLSGVGADTGGRDPGDYFRIHATVGATLTIATATPGGATLNGLDPAIDIYDATGKLIASNDNGASDGRNAVLTLTAPADGEYYVHLRAVNGTRGEYVLRVDGASNQAAPFTVSGVNPANGQVLGNVPTTVRVDFDRLLAPNSLQAADLTINGAPAAAVALIDGDTAEFTLPAGLAAGTHVLAMAAGAVTDTAGTPLTAFSSQFEVEVAPPRIVGVSLQDGATASVGTLIYVVEFSEPMNSDVLDSSDITLRGTHRETSYSSVVQSYDETGRFLTIQWNNLPDDEYTLTLLSADGRFEDRFGLQLDGENTGVPSISNPTGDGVAGGNFVARFTLDIQTPVLVTPTAAGTVSSLLANAVRPIYLSSGDADSFNITLAAGETLAVFVNPSETLHVELTVRDSQGAVVAQVQGSTVDGNIHIPGFTAASAETYTVTVSAIGDSSGPAFLQITKNGTFESESHVGGSNDTLATAQDLTHSFTHLPWDVRQVSVIAQSDGNDWYRFDLAAGETLAFGIDFTAIGPLGSNTLTLTDLSGEVLVTAPAGFFMEHAFQGFNVPVSGTYYLHLEGNALSSYRVVAAVNADLQDNSFATQGQNITGVSGVLGTLSTGTGVFVHDNRNGEINQFDPLTGEFVRTIYTYTGSNWGTDSGFASTGNTLLTTGAGSEWIREIDVETGAILRMIKNPNRDGSGLAYLDGEIFMLGNEQLGEIIVLDYTTGAVKRTIAADVALDRNLAASPTHLISLSGDTLFQIDTQTGLTTSLGKVKVPPSPTPGKMRAEGLGVFDGKLYVSYVSASSLPFSGSSTFQVYDLNTLQVLPTPSDFLNKGNGVAGDSHKPANHTFTIDVAEGGTKLHLSTLTPGGLQNTLNPKIEVLDSNGNVVASDTNSAVDGRNAELTYTVATAGTVTVRVVAEAGDGEYFLRVLGANSINDAPILDSEAPSVVTDILEDQAMIPGTHVADVLGLNTANPVVFDLDAGALAGIAITGADETHGKWEYSLDGTNWAALGTVSETGARLLAAEALVRFVPAPDYHGQASFSYRAWDQTTGVNGGTADTTTNGGNTAFSTASDSARITVLPVDDLPDMAGPGAQVTREDGPLTFSATNGNRFLLQDRDGGETLVKVTISAAHGTLTLGSIDGITFSSGDGVADASMVFVGNPAMVNAALEGLVFTPDTEFAGQAEISIALHDPAQPDGQAPAASALVPVKVTPVIEFTNTATFTDANGDLVKVVLRGGGSGEIWLPDTTGDALAIVLDSTTARSTLTITTPRGTETVIGDLVVHGELKSLVASTTDLSGTLEVTGTLRSIVLDDVTGGSIRIHTNSEQPIAKGAAVALKLDRVSDASLATNGIPIASLVANEWLNSDQERDLIQAPSIGALKILGSRKQKIAGNFGADLSVEGKVQSIKVAGDATGNVDARAIGLWQVGGDLLNAEVNLSQPVDAKRTSVLALGSLKVGGLLDSTMIDTAGRIGAVTLGGMRNSRIFAGVENNDSASLPDDSTDFSAAASIRSLALLGSGAEFTNSRVAAASIGRLTLRGIDAENAETPFGVAADRIAALVLKHGGKTTRQQNLVNTDQSVELEDFVVRIV